MKDPGFQKQNFKNSEGNFQDFPSNFRGFSRQISKNFEGNFEDFQGKFPRISREILRIFEIKFTDNGPNNINHDNSNLKTQKNNQTMIKTQKTSNTVNCGPKHRKRNKVIAEL